MAEEFKSFVGIDVSESCFEVCVLPQATRRRFAQDAERWQALGQIVALQPVPLVVVEATGGLERPVARLLIAARIAVAVVNPRQIATARWRSLQRVRSCGEDRQLIVLQNLQPAGDVRHMVVSRLRPSQLRSSVVVGKIQHSRVEDMRTTG